jgi:hypothetical protein
MCGGSSDGSLGTNDVANICWIILSRDGLGDAMAIATSFWTCLRMMGDTSGNLRKTQTWTSP